MKVKIRNIEYLTFDKCFMIWLLSKNYEKSQKEFSINEFNDLLLYGLTQIRNTIGRCLFFLICTDVFLQLNTSKTNFKGSV